MVETTIILGYLFSQDCLGAVVLHSIFAFNQVSTECNFKTSICYQVHASYSVSVSGLILSGSKYVTLLYTKNVHSDF